MSIEAKEIIKQLVKEQQFTSTGEIMLAMKEMFKEVLEESLEAELDTQLGYEKSERSDSKNRRNGHSRKTVRSELGEIEVSVPRDRDGEYEPKILPKNSRSVEGLEDKILSLYAAGLSTRDIHTQIQELYGVDVSAETVSRVTDRVLPLIAQVLLLTLSHIG